MRRENGLINLKLAVYQQNIFTDLQDISLHIEYLLRYHECVILPGIGAFLRTGKPASIKEDGTICAPQMQVCFNSSITASDGLLAHSVARRDKVSFEEAAATVSNAAEECRSALDSDGELSIGRLGRLSTDSEKRISFLPYPPLYSDIWADIHPGKSFAASGKSADTLSEQSETEQTDKDYYIIRISRKAVRYAAIAAICLLTAATVLLPSASRDGFNMTANKQYASVVPGVERLAVRPSAAPEPKVAVPTEKPGKEASSAEADTCKRYYLIVATFSKVSDCRKFIDNCSDKQNLSIVSTDKVSRVYSAASNNRDELIALLNSDAHKSLHPQAWVWKMQNAE